MARDREVLERDREVMKEINVYTPPPSEPEGYSQADVAAALTALRAELTAQRGMLEEMRTRSPGPWKQPTIRTGHPPVARAGSLRRARIGSLRSDPRESSFAPQPQARARSDRSPTASMSTDPRCPPSGLTDQRFDQSSSAAGTEGAVGQRESDRFAYTAPQLTTVRALGRRSPQYRSSDGRSLTQPDLGGA
eukprot:TRINITY_DN7823_c0_g1_i4.p1 TRINITY_DN7823_c0_g1~~TRINITY_DN7823_c0_g1_i4.p1  ORF type:complete len:192 (+),score=37.31 TRINITY_DN7823_c0_g1_i4:33-608(+)